MIKRISKRRLPAIHGVGASGQGGQSGEARGGVSAVALFPVRMASLSPSTKLDAAYLSSLCEYGQPPEMLSVNHIATWIAEECDQSYAALVSVISGIPLPGDHADLLAVRVADVAKFLAKKNRRMPVSWKIYLKTRKDWMALEIDAVRKELGANPTPGEVYAVLKNYAGKHNSCILAETAKGLKCEGQDDRVHYLNMDALKKRLRPKTVKGRIRGG